MLSREEKQKIFQLRLSLLDLPQPETLGGKFSFIERSTVKL